MSFLRPTFTTGFAKNAGESAFPNLWKGLIGIWSPELGKQGDKLYDFSGRNHHGTLNNMDAATDYIGGKWGYALNLDGTNDYLDFGTFYELDDASQNIAVALWMRSTATGSQALLTYDNNSVLQPATDWYMYCQNSANLKIGGFGSTGELDTGITSASLRDGKWHHIVVILKQTTIEVYVDGVLRYNPANTKTHGNFNNTFLLQFGHTENLGAYYAGDVGEIIVYNRELYAHEVRDLYLGASPLTLDPVTPTFGYPDVNMTVTPNVLDITSAVEAPVLKIDVTTFPAVLDILSAIIAPADVAETVSFTASTLDISSTVNNVNFEISFTLTPATLNILAAQLAPVVPQDATFIATLLNIAATTNAPSVDIAVTYSAYAQKIVSYNPLIFVTNTSPARLVKVDVTVPASPTWGAYELIGIDSAKDVFVNETTGYVYVVGANGKVCKALLSNLSTQTIIDVSDTDNLTTIMGLTDTGFTYVGTDNGTGELYQIDERNAFEIDTDFQAIAPVSFEISTDFNIVASFGMDTDFRALGQVAFEIDTDFKCLDYVVGYTSLDSITPINFGDVHVYIDNVELAGDDLIVKSVQVVHSIDEESQLSFSLARRHDELNKTLSGDTVTITNQNAVKLIVNGHVEFDGFVSEIAPEYNKTADIVNVTAFMNQPTTQYNNVTMSLPGLTSRLSLYDILMESPRISNPVIDDRIIIVGGNYFWTNANTWSLSVNDVKVFATYQDADDYISDKKEDNTDTVFLSKNPQVSYPNINPKKYKGIAVDLGTKTVEKVARYYNFDSLGSDAQKITKGTFNPVQNWTYFWSPTVVRFGDFTLGQTTQIGFDYIGTSMAPVSNDLWLLKYAKNRRQRVYPNKVTDLGVYTIGEAPFQLISTGATGQYIPQIHWTDKEDGLYAVTPVGYNYIDFCKKIADLEYKKLSNINGDILPDTSATFTLTPDAYYYYQLKLLTRMNVDNTTTDNIFNNTNGFPISIKSITINFGTMKVTIQANNTKSKEELATIDGEFPDELDPLYYQPETSHLIAQKSDMKTRLKVT